MQSGLFSCTGEILARRKTVGLKPGFTGETLHGLTRVTVGLKPRFTETSHGLTRVTVGLKPGFTE